MDFTKHRQAIESLFEDRATIKRHGDSETPHGETVQGPVLVYEDQPCRLSQKSLASDGQTEAQNNISYDLKLFISPDLTILQGDEIDVTHHGRTLECVAGEPFVYGSHQEVNLVRRGHA